MQAPHTRYAKSEGVSVAYQAFGDGPVAVVYAPGWISHVDVMWEDPMWTRFMARLGKFARVILFDKRGTGASDRDVGYPTLDDRMDDIRAVMDSNGVERAALFGTSEGGNMSILFAAAFPERVTHLMLYGVFAKREWAEDYPWAPTPEARADWIRGIEQSWGQDAGDIETIAPSRKGDRAFAEWYARLARMAASPGTAKRLADLNTKIDVRAALPAIRAPTLVMHSVNDRDASVEEARFIAERISGARFVAMPGADHMPWTENVDLVADEMEQFITGVRTDTEANVMLATILCTDIVGSTARRVDLGDAAWQTLIAKHDAAVAAVLHRRQGVAINTTGDGVLAAFNTPARAIRAAFDIQEAARALDLPVRAGLHTGECRRDGASVSGIAVDIAVRIASEGGPDEVFASRTVRDLAIGSGFNFTSRGERALKGAPGAWEILEVSAA